MRFIFLTQNKVDTQQFFKLLKRLQSIIFPIRNSFDFVIDKALTVNLVLNYLMPNLVGKSGTVSNTGHFSFDDFRNPGQ